LSIYCKLHPRGIIIVVIIKKAIFITTVVAIVAWLGIRIYFYDRIPPKVMVAGVNIGLLKTTAAVEKLKTNFSGPEIKLHWGTSEWIIVPSDISLQYDFANSVSQKNGLVFSLSDEQLTEKIASISANINVPAADPEITVVANKINVTSGENGLVVDERLLAGKIKSALTQGKYEIDIPVKLLTPKLTPDQMNILKNRAGNLLNKMVIVKFENQSWNITSEQLISWLDPQGFKVVGIQAWVEELATTLNRLPQNAFFRFEGEEKVEEFRPPKLGIKVKNDELTKTLLMEFLKLEKSSQNVEVKVPTLETAPTITLADVNKLGIKELVGRGTSDFSGSIPNRVFNVGLAASAMNGILVAPDEIFSFVKYIGDISASTGYKPAYVIKEGRTVLGDGGGVCQVSTTLFRAILDAGLPIIERTAHAYRVHYYENDKQPGFDATVFSPTVDFKFKNDTGNYLLIQTIFDAKKNSLVFELYGTRDGRVVTLSKARVWDVSPPPPDLYQDDPSLNKGVVRQVDWSAWGAKSAFDWKVTRNGEVLQERTFYSNYRPWQAVFLRGTK